MCGCVLPQRSPPDEDCAIYASKLEIKTCPNSRRNTAVVVRCGCRNWNRARSSMVSSVDQRMSCANWKLASVFSPGRSLPALFPANNPCPHPRHLAANHTETRLRQATWALQCRRRVQPAIARPLASAFFEIYPNGCPHTAISGEAQLWTNTRPMQDLRCWAMK